MLHEGQPRRQLRRLAGAVADRLLQLVVHSAQLREVVRDPLDRGRLHGGQGGRAGALHPVQDAGRRRRADNHAETESAELGPVARSQCPQLHRAQRDAVLGEVVQPGPAVPQHLGPLAAGTGGQRRGDPAVEAGEHRCPPGQRPGPVQRVEGHRVTTDAQRDPPGLEVRVHRGRRHPGGLQDPADPAQRAHVGAGHRPGPRRRGDRHHLRQGRPARAALRAEAGRRDRGRARGRREVLGEQRQPGQPPVALGRHEGYAVLLEVGNRPAGHVRRLGQQAQVDERVDVLDVVLAQRQAGLLVQPRSDVELLQALGQAAGLHGHPAADSAR